MTTRGDTRGPACATRRTRSLSPLSARAWARALPGQKSESAGQRNWNAWPGVERLKPIDRCTTVDRLYPRNSIEMKFFFRSFEIFINRSIVESTRSLNFPIEFFFRRTRIESKYLRGADYTNTIGEQILGRATNENAPRTGHFEVDIGVARRDRSARCR